MTKFQCERAQCVLGGSKKKLAKYGGAEAVKNLMLVIGVADLLTNNKSEHLRPRTHPTLCLLLRFG